MRKEIYIALSVIGVIFAILYASVQNDAEMAITSILITLHVLGYTYLFEEWRYYRSHNAILASFQFLAIPIALLLVGNILAPGGYEPQLIDFSIGLFGGIDASSSLASFILIIPIVSILRLTARYYDDRYSGFVFRNKRYGNLKFPLFIHLITIALLIVTAMVVGFYDVMGLGFIIVSFIQLIQKLIYPSISDRIADARYNRQLNRSSRRGYMSSILSNTPNRSRRGSSNRSSSSSSSSSSNVTSTNTRTRNRPVGGSVSTAPSSGYRDIPTRSRNDTSSSRSRSTRGSTPSRTAAAEVDSGVEVAHSTKKRKVKSSKLADYLPKGNYDRSDLKCIVCYDDFNTNSSLNIVICPECKFPGHESELLAWLNTSPRCPRCNKEISNRRKLRSKTVSESQYAKFIRKMTK